MSSQNLPEWMQQEAEPCGVEEHSLPAADSETCPPDDRQEYSQPDPLQEYGQSGGRKDDDGERHRRLVRKMLYAAAAVALGILLVKPGKPREAAVLPEPTAMPAATPEATVLPTETPEPTATPSPEPTPAEPGVEPLFFRFSSEYHAELFISDPEELESVYVEFRDRDFGDTVGRQYHMTIKGVEPETGRMRFPSFDDEKLWREHDAYYAQHQSEPVVEMIIKAVWTGADGSGETVIEKTVEASDEMGVYIRYWDFSSFAQEYGYPGQFEIGTYEDFESVRFVLDDPEAVTGPDVYSFSFECDGRKITEDEFHVEQVEQKETVFGEDGFTEVTVNKTVVLIPRPDWMPEEGTLHASVTRYLMSYGRAWTGEYVLTYPGSGDSSMEYAKPAE